MDILGQVLRALVGDQPPNGWTALIAIGLCFSWVATNWIKAWRQNAHMKFSRESPPEQAAKVAPSEDAKDIKATSGGAIIGVLLVLFFAGAMARFDANRGSQSVMQGALSAADKKPKIAAPTPCPGGCPPKTTCNPATKRCEGTSKNLIRQFWDDIGDDGYQMTSELTIPPYWEPLGRGHSILQVAFNPWLDEMDVCQ